MRVRDVDEGRAYPPADGVLPVTRWTAAGSPDYPWLFATDGEYTAFASVAAEQFDIVRAHLRARDASDLPNDGSGKVIREMAFTGDVYFGSNSGPAIPTRPQLPPGHTSASGSKIRVGSGSVGAGISQAGNRLRVRVRFNRVSAALTLGAGSRPRRSRWSSSTATR